MVQRNPHGVPAWPAASRWSGALPVLILAGVAAISVGMLTPRVWLVVVGDGALVGAVLIGAGGWGAWPARWLGLSAQTLGRQLCVAVALGLGLLGLAALALGVAGGLNRVSAWVLIISGTALGVLRMHHALTAGRDTQPREPDDGPPSSAGSIALRALVLLPLAVPLAVTAFGVALPPGLLWADEAYGYDVLEYHLQAPREYFESGRIHFLPHNVYAAFPQQIEMLYLLLMHLLGSVHAAAIPAQLLHGSLGVLLVVALVVWAAPGWTRLVVSIVVGSVPWLAYLGCLAYVELGMLFFGAVAAGLIADQLRSGRRDVGRYAEYDRRDLSAPRTARQADLGHYLPSGNRPSWKPAMAAGLCAGLAAGCKYTAVVLVSGALGVAWVLAMAAPFRERARQLSVYTLGALMAFAPWLIRNHLHAGNPVYPFAYQWFGGAAWSEEQAEQWARGHRLPAEQASLGWRAGIAAEELFSSGMFGPGVWVLPLIGLVRARSRQSLLAVLWLLLAIGAWAALTHMPGRFAVVVILPLALILCGQPAAGRPLRRTRRSDATDACEQPAAGRPLRRTRRSDATGVRGQLARAGRLTQVVVMGIAVMGALVGDAKLLSLLRQEEQRTQRLTGESLSWWVDQTHVRLRVDPVNAALGDRPAHAWLVGGAAVFYVLPRLHYTVVFNRDPWLEFAARASPEQALAWLRTRNVTHVIFSWAEIERLRRTYGFAPLVTPEWVAELEQAGLRPVAGIDAVADMAVYEVPPP